jgi:hypothetical protein
VVAGSWSSDEGAGLGSSRRGGGDWRRSHPWPPDPESWDEEGVRAVAPELGDRDRRRRNILQIAEASRKNEGSPNPLGTRQIGAGLVYWARPVYWAGPVYIFYPDVRNSHRGM